MPSNIEIKARARDFEEIRRHAESLSDTSVEVIPQEDIFFNTEKGRLKLRDPGTEIAGNSSITRAPIRKVQNARSIIFMKPLILKISNAFLNLPMGFAAW